MVPDLLMDFKKVWRRSPRSGWARTAPKALRDRLSQGDPDHRAIQPEQDLSLQATTRSHQGLQYNYQVQDYYKGKSEIEGERGGIEAVTPGGAVPNRRSACVSEAIGSQRRPGHDSGGFRLPHGLSRSPAGRFVGGSHRQKRLDQPGRPTWESKRAHAEIRP